MCILKRKINTWWQSLSYRKKLVIMKFLNIKLCSINGAKARSLDAINIYWEQIPTKQKIYVYFSLKNNV